MKIFPCFKFRRTIIFQQRFHFKRNLFSEQQTMPALLFCSKCGGVPPDTRILQRDPLCLPCYGDKHGPTGLFRNILPINLRSFQREILLHFIWGNFLQIFFFRSRNLTILKWTCSYRRIMIVRHGLLSKWKKIAITFFHKQRTIWRIIFFQSGLSSQHTFVISDSGILL